MIKKNTLHRGVSDSLLSRLLLRHHPRRQAQAGFLPAARYFLFYSGRLLPRPAFGTGGYDRADPAHDGPAAHGQRTSPARKDWLQK